MSLCSAEFKPQNVHSGCERQSCGDFTAWCVVVVLEAQVVCAMVSVISK